MQGCFVPFACVLGLLSITGCMHGLTQSYLQHTASISRIVPLRAMRRALSDPDSLQVQKQLQAFLAPRKATRKPRIPSRCQNLCRLMPSSRGKPPSTPDRIFAQTGSPNYSFDKRISFVYVRRFSMPKALRLSPGIIPDTRRIFFAALWCHSLPVGL